MQKMMRKSGMKFFLVAPTVSHAAAPVYFDLGGLILTVAFYVIGAVAVLIWLFRSPSLSRMSYLWKTVVVLTYFVVIPGYPLAQKAYLINQSKLAEERRAQERAEAKVRYEKFCLENLKREKPLEACKKFGPSAFNPQQKTAK
jgi:hypothetical protein